MKYSNKIIKQRASLEDLQSIAFDMKAMENIMNRIRNTYDRIALRMVDKTRKTDKRSDKC